MNAYFEHVAKMLSISNDCIFNTRVTSAEFDVQKARWVLQADNNGQQLTITAKYFLPAVGLSSKQYIPSWKGLEWFQGTICHSSTWPKEGIDVRGKCVAVIGTGATGVQIIQQWAKEASELFVYQRTPNLALRMSQKAFDASTQEQRKEEARMVFANFRESCTNLFPGERPTKAFADLTAEEWEKVLNDRYVEGGFSLGLFSMTDLFVNDEGNRFVYDFWARKTRERIHDPVKRDLLAPLDPPHHFGTKRPSLEQDYYEQFNRPNVHIVNTKADPIAELTPHGIVNESGIFHEVDVIAICTGFDASTGALMDLNIRDINGVDLRERWRNGVSNFLGVAVPGFPNMFVVYGALSPGGFGNSIMLIEWQVDWIRDLIRKIESMESSGRYLETSPEAAQVWREESMAIANSTLLPQINSWWTGANIPGKEREFLYYLGGLKMYKERCIAALDTNFGKVFSIH